MNYYKDDMTGSFYSLENGELVQYPMNIDGSMDPNGCSVELDDLLFEMPELIDGNEVDMHTHLSMIKSNLEGNKEQIESLI